MEKLCPKCGKRPAMDIFCEECYTEQNPLLKDFKELEIVICTKCKQHLIKGQWHNYSNLEQALVELLKSRLRFNTRAVIKNIKAKPILPDVTLAAGVNVNATAAIEITGKIHKKQKSVTTEAYDVPLKLKYTICKTCGKEGTQYFEGTLQVRNITPEVQNLIDREVGHAKGVFITDTIEHKNGIDYFLTSNKFVIELGRKIFNEFGGIWEISRKLFTRNSQTSKDVYRVTFLIVLPNFKKGDIIKIEKVVLKVDSARARNVYGINLKTWKQAYYDYKDSDCELKCKKEDLQEAVVSKIYPNIEVIDPNTFQSVPVANKRHLRINETVKVASIDGVLWLVF
jgi:NMD protein affecting ribosome stability and mRNA decay